MRGIHVSNITKRMRLPNRNLETVFDGFSLSVGPCETLGIFGPNGCGKTTLFNMISGIIPPDSGEIRIHGRNAGKNNIAYIFQDYRNSLFPWLTIRENIIFPLKVKKLRKVEIDYRLNSIIELAGVGLELSKYPYQLSGGQQQYVAIIRGLISEPDVMLVDEPFSALDYTNTMWLMEKIAVVQRKINIPTILISHDIEHLVFLADRIVFLSAKPARVLTERAVQRTSGGRRFWFDYDLLEEMKNDIQGIYRQTLCQMAL